MFVFKCKSIGWWLVWGWMFLLAKGLQVRVIENCKHVTSNIWAEAFFGSLSIGFDASAKSKSGEV